MVLLVIILLRIRIIYKLLLLSYHSSRFLFNAIIMKFLISREVVVVSLIYEEWTVFDEKIIQYTVRKNTVYCQKSVQIRHQA